MIPYFTRFFLYSALLILLQSLIFDQINLFGFSNPMVYVLLFITYRFNLDQFNFILIGFAVGLILDLLTQTAGGHTIASLSIVFLRPVIIRFALGSNYDIPNAIYTGVRWPNRMLYILLMLLIHQLIFSLIAFFSLAHFWTVIQYTIVNTIFSFILIVAILNLMSSQK